MAAHTIAKLNKKSQLTPQERAVLRPILDQKLDYRDVSISELQINLDYQDRPREKLVAQIAAEPLPVLFGVPIAAQHPDGSYWIVDGATRILGWRKAKRQEKIRIQVLQTEGVKQDALLFKHYNSARKLVPLANRLQAEGLAGVDGGFKKMVERTGFKLIGSGKNTIKGASFVFEAFHIDPDACERALFALKQEWSTKHRINGGDVLALAKLYASQRQSVDAPIRALLRKTDPNAIESQVKRMWGGGKSVDARMHPGDRSNFAAKAFAVISNRYNRKSKIDIDRLDSFLQREEAA